MKVERRFFAAERGGEVELREEGGVVHLIGHAAVFDVETEIYRGFAEVVRPGAFSEVLATDDVRGLFNHDTNIVLGRNRSGTMALREDDRGLVYDITAPSTDYVRDVVLEPMRRGDVTGSSFSFSILTQSWTERLDDELREILKVRQLYDVGPVTFPAYPTTDAQVRSALAECTSTAEIELFELLRDSGLTPEQRQAIMQRKSGLAREDEAQSASELAAWHGTTARKLALLGSGA